MSRVYPNDKPSRRSPEIWFQASSIRRCYRLAYACLKFTWEGTFILHRHWPKIANTLAFLSGEHDINASPTTIAWLQKFTCSLGWPFVSIVFIKIKVVAGQDWPPPTSTGMKIQPWSPYKFIKAHIPITSWSALFHDYLHMCSWLYIYIYCIIIKNILDIIYIYIHM